jgi:hypothetical protein
MTKSPGLSLFEHRRFRPRRRLALGIWAIAVLVMWGIGWLAYGMSSRCCLSEFCDRSVAAQMARAAAVQIQDPPAGAALWQRVEQSLLARAVAVPTYVPGDVIFVSKRVGNFQFNPQAGVLLTSCG